MGPTLVQYVLADTPDPALWPAAAEALDFDQTLAAIATHIGNTASPDPKTERYSTVGNQQRSVAAGVAEQQQHGFRAEQQAGDGKMPDLRGR